MNQVKVLILIESLDRAGVETVIINYLRNFNRDHIKCGILLNCMKKSGYEEEVEKLGVTIFHMCELNSGSYKKEFKEFLIAHREYEIIHSYLEEKGIQAMTIAKELLIPVRISHAYTTTKKMTLNIGVHKGLAELCTDLFASSEDAAKRLFGNDKLERVKYIRNAVDVITFQYQAHKEAAIKNELEIKDDQFVISCIGRFASEKNQDFAIDIFYELNDVKKAILLFVGDGRNPKELKQKEAIIKKTKRLGLEDRIKFLGMRDDVDKILSATDLLLMPSKKESVAVTLFEAQASGAKCLVSDKVPEAGVVTDDVIIFPLKKPSRAWACKVMDVAHNNQKVISANDHRKQREENSLKNCTKMLREGYDIVDNAKWLEKFYAKALQVLA